MIYCVEDDNSIRELMVYTFRSTGIEGRGFSCAEEFWEGMNEAFPELIILDLMLPGEDGITILKKLKASPATENIPVIIATAKGAEYDKIIGLDTGADDYLVKPFGMMEMVSRIRAVLRRAKPTASGGVIRVSGIELNKVKHRVTVLDRETVLTLKEYDLLLLLMENIGHVFTRDQILASVWQSDADFETRTVDVHIGNLRTKLGEYGKLIKTVRGVGYKMEDADE